MTFHHLVFDGWSTGIFLSELGALHHDEAAALPPLQAQYRDYPAWRQARAGTPQSTADIGYWTDLLADAPQLLVRSMSRVVAVPIEPPPNGPRPVTARNPIFLPHSGCGGGASPVPVRAPG